MAFWRPLLGRRELICSMISGGIFVYCNFIFWENNKEATPLEVGHGYVVHTEQTPLSIGCYVCILDLLYFV